MIHKEMQATEDLLQRKRKSASNIKCSFNDTYLVEAHSLELTDQKLFVDDVFSALGTR